MKHLIIAIVAALLTACGGGGSDSPAPAPQAPPPVVVTPPAPAATDFVFWGNSLTYVPFDVDYIPGYMDWGKGGWGMAASAPEKDFVHIVSTAKGLPFVALNLASNERDPAAPLPDTAIRPTTYVVIQLGDNGLAAHYAELVQRAKAGKKLICVSTWGYDQILRQRDAVMRPICESAGGTWVDISDIFPVRQDDIGRYSIGGVDAHPHDASMAEIARRILQVLP